jgi:type I restriction enzyme S subunit
MILSTETIPEDWHHVKLKEICIDNQQGFASGKRDTDGVKQIRMNNVTNDGRFILDIYIKVPAPSNIEKYDLKKGDILFNNTNSADLVGKTAVIDNEAVDFTFSNHFNRIRVDTKTVLPEWIKYLFEIKWQQGYFKRICRRYVHQAGIGKSEIEEIPISFPSLLEQNRVIEIISSVEKVILRSDELISKTEKLKKGLMEELLIKGIRHQSFKDSKMGRIPQEWIITKLGNIAYFKNGINYTKEKKGKIGIPLIDVLNMYGGGISVNLGKLFRVNLSFDKDSDFLLKKGDILFVRSSLKREGAGWSSLFNGANEPITFCGFIIRARLISKDVIPEFITYFLRSKTARRHLIAGAGQVAISNVSQEILNTLDVPIPPISEQQKIVEILFSIDKKLILEQKRKEKLEKIKKSLMNDLLTGKKRVKTAR